MRAAEELELEGAKSPVPWWEVAPFHGASPPDEPSFVSALSLAAALEPRHEDPASAEIEHEESVDPALLSYENALRTPASQPGATGRSARVTIRLSDTEYAQLRRRAADAGLTVSAYLRACVLEAEKLRAEVKEALAQLRAAPVAEKPPEQPRRWWLRREGLAQA
jgi:predicted DNA binding CopG/RHH family protein